VSFLARYYGTCRDCQGKIEPGMDVTYIEDVLVHVSCDQVDAIVGYSRVPITTGVVCPKCHLETAHLVNGLCRDCT
jgi:hypothetical protein